MTVKKMKDRQVMLGDLFCFLPPDCCTFIFLYKYPEGRSPSRCSRCSGIFTCHKLQKFTTGSIIGHKVSVLSDVIGIPEREKRATFFVDIVQDQFSGR